MVLFLPKFSALKLEILCCRKIIEPPSFKAVTSFISDLEDGALEY